MEETKQKITYPEYLLWCRHWEEEKSRPDRTAHYLMAVARELRLLYHMHTNNTTPITHEEMRLDFENPDHIKVPKKLTEEQIQQMVVDSTRRWGTLINSSGKGNKNDKRR